MNNRNTYEDCGVSREYSTRVSIITDDGCVSSVESILGSWQTIEDQWPDTARGPHSPWRYGVGGA